MLAYDGPVVADCRVAKLANCFPMFASSAPHTDMIQYQSEVVGDVDDSAKTLV